MLDKPAACLQEQWSCKEKGYIALGVWHCRHRWILSEAGACIQSSKDTIVPKLGGLNLPYGNLYWDYPVLIAICEAEVILELHITYD